MRQRSINTELKLYHFKTRNIEEIFHSDFTKSDNSMHMFAFVHGAIFADIASF